MSELKNQNYTIIATTLCSDSKSIYETSYKNKKIALLLGNERDGLTKTAIELADEKIIIPMAGMVQSFNLSVSVSIFLYEITRQRKKSNFDHIFSLAEKEALIASFQSR